MNQLQEEIIKTVQYIVSQNLKKADHVRLLEGVVLNRFNDRYNVMIENQEYFDIPPLDPERIYEDGDRVYILIQNSNFADKVILGHSVGGKTNSSWDKKTLPTEPVRIVRENDDPEGRAYRFDYGFEGYPPQKAWSQILHRDGNDVVAITNHYYDGTVEYRYLLRNSANRVEYYGKNQNFTE